MNLSDDGRVENPGLPLHAGELAPGRSLQVRRRRRRRPRGGIAHPRARAGDRADAERARRAQPAARCDWTTAPAGARLLRGAGGGRGGVERAAVVDGPGRVRRAEHDEGFAVGVALFTGYLTSAAFLLVALAKPIFPDNVGVRWVDGEFRGAGLEFFLGPETVGDARLGGDGALRRRRVPVCSGSRTAAPAATCDALSARRLRAAFG